MSLVCHGTSWIRNVLFWGKWHVGPVVYRLMVEVLDATMTRFGGMGSEYGARRRNLITLQNMLRWNEVPAMKMRLLRRQARIRSGDALL